MPIFEYRCKNCDQTFEELIRSSDAGRVKCPHCDSKRTERQLSVFAARTAESPTPTSFGGCGRCGDPNGPCQSELG